MSYNLLAEGDLDLFEWSHLAALFEPLELFPIPAEDAGPPAAAAGVTSLAPDAIGIAVPSRGVGPDAVANLGALVQLLWERDARVFDLHVGRQIATRDELDDLLLRVGG